MSLALGEHVGQHDGELGDLVLDHVSPGGLDLLLHLGLAFFHFPSQLMLGLEVSLSLFLSLQLLLVALKVFFNALYLLLLVLSILLDLKLGLSDFGDAHFFRQWVFIIYHRFNVLVLGGKGLSFFDDSSLL